MDSYDRGLPHRIPSAFSAELLVAKTIPDSPEDVQGIYASSGPPPSKVCDVDLKIFQKKLRLKSKNAKCCSVADPLIFEVESALRTDVLLVKLSLRTDRASTVTVATI